MGTRFWSPARPPTGRVHWVGPMQQHVTLFEVSNSWPGGTGERSKGHGRHGRGQGSHGSCLVASLPYALPLQNLGPCDRCACIQRLSSLQALCLECIPSVLHRAGWVRLHDFLQLLSGELLALEQLVRGGVERLRVRLQHLHAVPVRAVHEVHRRRLDPVQRRVGALEHAAGDGVAKEVGVDVVHVHLKVALHEADVAAGRRPRGDAQVRHTVGGHHLLRELPQVLDVAHRVRGGIPRAKHDVLRGAAGGEHADALQQARLGRHCVVLVAAAQEDGAAEVGAARHHADALHRLDLVVALAQHRGHQPLAHLVRRNHALFDQAVLQCWPPHALQHAVHRVVDVIRVDGIRVAPQRLQRRLVEHVGQLGWAEPGEVARHLVQVHVRGHGVLAGVHPQHVAAAHGVWLEHLDLAVKAAGAHEGGVEQVRAVGGRHKDDADVGREAVHLREQLVQRLLALLVGLHARLRALDAQRVDLVHKDDARRVDARALEEVAHARGAHAHDDLHKLRAAHLEKRHAALARDRLGDEGLARAWAALQQHALGRLGVERGIALGVLQEGHHLAQLRQRLVQPRHVRKAHVGEPLLARLTLALRKLHCLDLVARHHPARAEDADGEADAQEAEGKGVEGEPGHALPHCGHAYLLRRLVVGDLEQLVSGAVVFVLCGVHPPLAGKLLPALLGQPLLVRLEDLQEDLVVAAVHRLARLQRLALGGVDGGAAVAARDVVLRKRLRPRIWQVTPHSRAVRLGDHRAVAREGGRQKAARVLEKLDVPRLRVGLEQPVGPVALAEAAHELNDGDLIQLVPVRLGAVRLLAQDLRRDVQIRRLRLHARLSVRRCAHMLVHEVVNGGALALDAQQVLPAEVRARLWRRLGLCRSPHCQPPKCGTGQGMSTQRGQLCQTACGASPVAPVLWRGGRQRAPPCRGGHHARIAARPPCGVALLPVATRSQARRYRQ
mmetsp:Transcript_14045/g.35385  ORF Transcript_14045/g.35385 Transcript_14045/m.35385 type:complete len:951 (-) Transcript_14045:158-3010(-)